METQTLITVEENEVLPPKFDPHARARKIARLRAISDQNKAQKKAFADNDIFARTIEAKLRKAGAYDRPELQLEQWLQNFGRCGNENFTVMCDECRRARTVSYQCCLKFCPRCSYRVSLKRKALMGKITCGMSGMRHVVLTQRNFYADLKKKIRESRANLPKLRRQRICKNVTGGCASLEFTNEKKGWHLHWHLLIQSQFIDASELSKCWGRLVGQDFAIVKVKNVTEESYLAELCKYVVGGAELAGWTPEQILEFILAIKGTRTFSTFGKFRGMAKFAREVLATEKPGAPPCACGCQTFTFGTNEAHCERIIRSYYGEK